MEWEVAVRRADRWSLIDITMPLGTLVAFEETFGVSFPDSGETGHMWRHMSWLAHRADQPDRPFDEWLREIDEVVAGDGLTDEIRAKCNPRPTELPVKRAPAGSAARTEPGTMVATGGGS
jgi:hypothetical protein